MRKKTFLLSLIISLFLLLTLFSAPILAVSNEGQNFDEAVNFLQALACNILEEQCSSAIPGQPYFTIGCLGGNICWNSDSIIGSSSDLRSYFNLSVSPSSYENGGDVRYRCRRQFGTIHCFAYRCEQAEPAGCRQMWRIQFTLKYTSNEQDPETLTLVDWDQISKCFDVGETDEYTAKVPICQRIHTDTTYGCGPYTCR